ncbi:MAG: lytic transglycosylase domain-containing protein [Candidatus Aquicultor sp.]
MFFALIQQESGWNSRAISRVGAIGLTQVMPFNVKAMGYKLSRYRTSPVAQLECGAKILRAEFNRFGRWDHALAAYNAGGGAVSRYGGIPPYSETIHYVRNIMYMANYTKV